MHFYTFFFCREVTSYNVLCIICKNSATPVRGANLQPKYGISALMQVLGLLPSHKKGNNYKVIASNSEVTGGLVGLLVNCVYQPLKMLPYHDLKGIFQCKLQAILD